MRACHSWPLPIIWMILIAPAPSRTSAKAMVRIRHVDRAPGSVPLVVPRDVFGIRNLFPGRHDLNDQVRRPGRNAALMFALRRGLLFREGRVSRRGRRLANLLVPRGPG